MAVTEFQVGAERYLVHENCISTVTPITSRRCSLIHVVNRTRSDSGSVTFQDTADYLRVNATTNFTDPKRSGATTITANLTHVSSIRFRYYIESQWGPSRFTTIGICGTNINPFYEDRAQWDRGQSVFVIDGAPTDIRTVTFNTKDLSGNKFLFWGAYAQGTLQFPNWVNSRADTRLTELVAFFDAPESNDIQDVQIKQGQTLTWNITARKGGGPGYTIESTSTQFPLKRNEGVATGVAVAHSHRFLNVGTHRITYKVTDAEYGYVQKYFNVTVVESTIDLDAEYVSSSVHASPIVRTNPGSVPINHDVVFNATATFGEFSDGGTITWSGDITGTGTGVVRQFTSVGTKNVTVTATDSFGNTKTKSFTIQVFPRPQAIIRPLATSVHINTPIQFNAAESTGGDPLRLSSFVWTVEGSGRNGITYTHTPSNLGPLEVNLRMVDSYGYEHTAISEFTIFTVPPTANAGSNIFAKVGDTVTFDPFRSTTSDPGGLIYEWTSPLWSGIINGDSQGRFVFSLTEAGTFSVTLKVIDTVSQHHSHTITIEIRPHTEVTVDKIPGVQNLMYRVSIKAPDASFPKDVSRFVTSIECTPMEQNSFPVATVEMDNSNGRFTKNPDTSDIYLRSDILIEASTDGGENFVTLLDGMIVKPEGYMDSAGKQMVSLNCIGGKHLDKMDISPNCVIMNPRPKISQVFTGTPNIATTSVEETNWNQDDKGNYPNGLLYKTGYAYYGIDEIDEETWDFPNFFFPKNHAVFSVMNNICDIYELVFFIDDINHLVHVVKNPTTTPFEQTDVVKFEYGVNISSYNDSSDQRRKYDKVVVIGNNVHAIEGKGSRTFTHQDDEILDYEQAHAKAKSLASKLIQDEQGPEWHDTTIEVKPVLEQIVGKSVLVSIPFFAKGLPTWRSCVGITHTMGDGRWVTTLTLEDTRLTIGKVISEIVEELDELDTVGGIAHLRTQDVYQDTNKTLPENNPTPAGMAIPRADGSYAVVPMKSELELYTPGPRPTYITSCAVSSQHTTGLLTEVDYIFNRGNFVGQTYNGAKVVTPNMDYIGEQYESRIVDKSGRTWLRIGRLDDNHPMRIIEGYSSGLQELPEDVGETDLFWYWYSPVDASAIAFYAHASQAGATAIPSPTGVQWEHIRVSSREVVDLSTMDRRSVTFAAPAGQTRRSMTLLFSFDMNFDDAVLARIDRIISENIFFRNEPNTNISVYVWGHDGTSFKWKPHATLVETDYSEVGDTPRYKRARSQHNGDGNFIKETFIDNGQLHVAIQIDKVGSTNLQTAINYLKFAVGFSKGELIGHRRYTILEPVEVTCISTNVMSKYRLTTAQHRGTTTFDIHSLLAVYNNATFNEDTGLWENPSGKRNFLESPPEISGNTITFQSSHQTGFFFPTPPKIGDKMTVYIEYYAIIPYRASTPEPQVVPSNKFRLVQDTVDRTKSHVFQLMDKDLPTAPARLVVLFEYLGGEIVGTAKVEPGSRISEGIDVFQGKELRFLNVIDTNLNGIVPQNGIIDGAGCDSPVG